MVLWGGNKNKKIYNMTRKAIIIGNNTGLNAPTFLSGVTKDLENYQRYLTSDGGGRWYYWENLPNLTEVEILHNQGRQTILNAIRNCHADYSFVVFTGHGYTKSRDGLTYICVNGGEISEDELITSSQKQSLILDCCRQVESANESYNFSGTASMMNKAVALSATLSSPLRKINLPREKFDAALGVTTNGQFRGYACLIDQTSGDNPSSGGVFSTALMKEGLKFSSVNQERYWLTIQEAVILTKNELAKDPFTKQVPTYKLIPQRMNLTAPFAITNDKTGF